MLLTVAIAWLGLAASVRATEEALVFVFGSSETRLTSDVPSVSPNVAALSIAQSLGVSQYYSLGRADESTIIQLNGLSNEQDGFQNPSSKDEESRPNILLMVEGVSEVMDMYYSNNGALAFKILNPPGSSANTQFVRDLIAQDTSRRRGISYCTSELNSHNHVLGGYTKHDIDGDCLVEKLAAGQDTQDMLSELRGLYHILSGSGLGADLQDSTVIVHITSLQVILQRNGADSEPYLAAVALLKKIMKSLESQRKRRESTIILLPLTTTMHVKRAENPYGTYEVPLLELNARQEQEEPLSMTSGLWSSSPPSSDASPSQPQTLKASSLPRGPFPVCYSSAERCNDVTAKCSGHGECYEKYTERSSEEDSSTTSCWACMCGTSTRTNSDGTKKTTVWAGTACQKKDVASSFWLLAGFTIAALATVSWGIGLMFSIGQEDLPSVIGAGVAGPRAQK